MPLISARSVFDDTAYRCTALVPYTCLVTVAQLQSQVTMIGLVCQT